MEIRLLEVFFSSSFKTVIAEADLSWRILESGLRLTNIADAHRSFTFLASLCLCFFSSFWAKNKINSPLISPHFKHFALHPEGTENIPLGSPAVRLMFLKPKLNKESKNGFKTINYRRYPVMIFSKNCFRSKKFIKKIGRFVDL